MPGHRGPTRKYLWCHQPLRNAIVSCQLWELIVFRRQCAIDARVDNPSDILNLGLPFRFYIVALVAPAVGLALQSYIAYCNMATAVSLVNQLVPTHKLGTRYLWIYISVYSITVYGSCIASAWSNERKNRSLFTIQRALSDQRQALMSERDVTKYRYIMQQNREKYAV